MDPWVQREAMAAAPVIQRNLAELEAEAEDLQVNMKERADRLSDLNEEQKQDGYRHTVVVAEANGLRRILNELQSPPRRW